MSQLVCSKTIQLLKHKVRKLFGASELTFCGEERKYLDTLMGVYQGNDTGPAIWTIISSDFFDDFKDTGYEALLATPFRKNN